MKQRPCGITVLGVIYLILGGISLLWSLVVFGFGSVSWLTGSLFSADTMAASGGANVWAGILGLAAATIQIVAAIGLLQLKPWAWVLALIAVAVSVIQGLIGMFSGGLAAFCCGGFGVLIPIGILFYLLAPGIRASFRNRGAPAPMDVYIMSDFTPIPYDAQDPAESELEPPSLPSPAEPPRDA